MNHKCLVCHHQIIMDLNSKMKFKENSVQIFKINYYQLYKHFSHL